MSPAIDAPPPGRLTPGRRVLLLTILIFLAPVLVGGSLYIFGWRPTKMANHGELIQPPKALAFEELAGEVRTRTAGKWLLLIAGDGPCETACTELAEQSRAIQVSLNRDMGRLARIVLTAAPTPALRDLQTRQPDLMVVAPPAKPVSRSRVAKNTGCAASSSFNRAARELATHPASRQPAPLLRG